MRQIGSRIIWLEGLSGAGKSTIANCLATCLSDHGYRVKLVDGDELRAGLCSDLGFGIPDRIENVRRAAHAASILASTVDVVIVALITPLESMRAIVRSVLPTVVEVFVNAPIEVCAQRDPKGLYRKVKEGKLKEFSGVDSPFEIPTAAHLVCHTHRETIEESVMKVIGVISHSNPAERETEKGKRTIAVDFDGVIADYDGWLGVTMLGNPRTDVICALRLLKSEGWRIIIHTTRNAAEIQSYLLDASVPFDEINANSHFSTGAVKPVATVYWDDRALRYSGDALADLEMIRSFRTWSGRP